LNNYLKKLSLGIHYCTMKSLFKYILILLSSTLFAQSFPKSNDFDIHERFIDIDTIKLDLTINPYSKLVEGNAEILYHNLKPRIDSFFIHAVNYNLEQVLLPLSPNLFIPHFRI